MANVTLFENSGFTGKSIDLAPGQYRLDNFNDIASSIRVPAGMVAVVYEDADASGGYGLSADFMEDCANLSAFYLDDKISYVVVFPAKQPSGLVWVRSQFVKGDYLPGHWERPQVGGGPFNPPFATVSPPLLPHVLEISQVNGTPWVNPAFDTSDPSWSSQLNMFDGSKSNPFEWVSVLNPIIEQDDEVGVAGFTISPELSGNDLPFTHPFQPVPPAQGNQPMAGNDFEFTILPDAAYLPLLATANRDPKGMYSESWGAAHQLGLDVPGVLGLEVDAALVPEPDRPRHGDRMAAYGRWIVDAGHEGFHTEIHPPLLMAHARCVDTSGNPVPPTLNAITHVQFWSRPYQSGQLFNTDGDTGLCLQDYIDRILTTLGDVSAYPPVHDKPFVGVHLVAFTVRPPIRTAPLPKPPLVPQWRLECSYHFTVNGSCAVEVVKSPADPNAVLVLLALNDVNYPKLPLPPEQMKLIPIQQLLDDAKQHGESPSGKEKLWLDFLSHINTDHVGFRLFAPPPTSAQDSVNLVPFTPLDKIPASTVANDPQQTFPVRGWLRLGWVGLPSTGGGGVTVTIFDLSGSWAAGGRPGPKISRSDNTLTIDMSAYRRPPATGSVIDEHTITVTFPDDATYTGTLVPPGTITWSNHTSWTKL
jgi:hypothetical protein